MAVACLWMILINFSSWFLMKYSTHFDENADFKFHIFVDFDVASLCLLYNYIVKLDKGLCFNTCYNI